MMMHISKQCQWKLPVFETSISSIGNVIQ